MPQKYPKMCPVCNHSKLFNLSDHLNKVHGINGQERKYWLYKAPYSTISSHAVHVHSSVPQSYSTPAQFGNSLPKTSSLPEQKKLLDPVPSNSTSDENVLMIVASVMRGFGAPMFLLWTMTTSNCTTPSVC